MKKSSFVALILGTIGIVFFALGMCMALFPNMKFFLCVRRQLRQFQYAASLPLVIPFLNIIVPVRLSGSVRIGRGR